MDDIKNKVTNIYTNENLEQNFENKALVFGSSDSYFDN